MGFDEAGVGHVVWHAGVALACFVHAHGPVLTSQRRCLELGAGVGGESNNSTRTASLPPPATAHPAPPPFANPPTCPPSIRPNPTQRNPTHSTPPQCRV